MYLFGEFIISNYNYNVQFKMSRVDVPMGGSCEVYTSQDEDQQFNYVNVRKAAYRGSKTITYYLR